MAPAYPTAGYILNAMAAGTGGDNMGMKDGVLSLYLSWVNMRSQITSVGAKAAGNVIMEKALAVGKDKCHRPKDD